MEEIEELLTEYGNAMFDCGEWDGDNSEQYDDLVDRAQELKKKILKEIEKDG